MKYKHKTKNSFLIPHDTLDNEKFLSLSPACWKLYIILCKIINRMEFDSPDLKTHWFYHSVKQLAKRTGMSVPSVINAKQELNKYHFIDIKKGQYVNGRKDAADYFRLNGFRTINGEEHKFENYQ